ncbi:hypothetical protein Tco_0881971 [Tanacetum coccineum]
MWMCLLKIYQDSRRLRNKRMIGSTSGMIEYHGSMKNHGLMMMYTQNPLVISIMSAIHFASKMGLGNSIRYEDYEWYDTIEVSELKEEALINKKILDESLNVMEELSDDD